MICIKVKNQYLATYEAALYYDDPICQQPFWPHLRGVLNMKQQHAGNHEVELVLQNCMHKSVEYYVTPGASFSKNDSRGHFLKKYKSRNGLKFTNHLCNCFLFHA